MPYIILIPILISFLVALTVMKYWIKKARQINLLWEDMNKFRAEKVAGSGGVIVILAFVIGVLFYIAYIVFYLKSTDGVLIQIFALLTVILIVSVMGLIDDLLGWQHGGLSAKSRIILFLFSAIPLIAINAGKSKIAFPLLGNVELGLIYPLFILPIGIVGAATTFNILAGFNGLEAGQGIILLFATGITAYLTGNSWLFIIALCMIAALAAFLFYNFYPAKVFPGDVLTYSVGSLIAIMAILGNFEKIAVFFYIPYILEAILKSRGGLKKHSFGKPTANGELYLKYDKLYSLNHVAIYFINKMGFKSTERKVVFSIWIFQIAIVITGFLIFRKGIFS